MVQIELECYLNDIEDIINVITKMIITSKKTI